MKRHLNTIFVTVQDSWLSKNGECIVVQVDHQKKGSIPIHTLDGLVCFGRVGCSPNVLELCAQHGVTVSWFTEYGRFMAAMHGPTTGNVLLRRAQYRHSDDPVQAALLARAFVTGKIANCRTVLQRTLREHSEEGDGPLTRACEGLRRCLQRLPAITDLDTLRGVEGEAANIYFGAFNALIAPSAVGIRFQGRSRRPPLDEMNCLLSFLYALLTHDIRSALEGVGLDPQVGFLHRLRPGRPSLALDMMEEFRPALVDRLALTLCNRGQLKAGDFVCSDLGAVTLKEQARRDVLVAWQERKRQEVLHPFVGERMESGFLWHMQARLLARCIRGELDAYPPYVIR